MRSSTKRDAFVSRIANPYARHMLGMLAVGLLFYTLFRWQGHYFVEGVGYATVQNILVGGMDGIFLLLTLCVCKLLATSLSLGSGASGGIFSPSLFIGATLGSAFGAAVAAILPSAGLSIPAFAIVGMAAMVGGATGAAMTAVTMIFEMTRDYEIVMPMIVAVAVSIGVGRMLSSENIYTIKLVARRHFLPKALHANMFLVRRAVEVADSNFVTLPAQSERGTTHRRRGGHRWQGTCGGFRCRGHTSLRFDTAHGVISAQDINGLTAGSCKQYAVARRRANCFGSSPAGKFWTVCVTSDVN